MWPKRQAFCRLLPRYGLGLHAWHAAVVIAGGTEAFQRCWWGVHGKVYYNTGHFGPLSLYILPRYYVPRYVFGWTARPNSEKRLLKNAGPKKYLGTCQSTKVQLRYDYTALGKTPQRTITDATCTFGAVTLWPACPFISRDARISRVVTLLVPYCYPFCATSRAARPNPTAWGQCITVGRAARRHQKQGTGLCGCSFRTWWLNSPVPRFQPVP